MTDIQILSAVKNNGGSIDFTSLMNLSLTDVSPDWILTKARIEKLISDKSLEGKASDENIIRITKPGRIYLDDLIQQQNERTRKEAEDASQRESDRRKQNRHDWLITVVGGGMQTVIGAAGGAIITLLIQHFL